MTAREKILQAFEPDGTREAGAVSCYESIFIRDHWFSLTGVPWWYMHSGLIEKEVAWAGDVFEKTGLEWLAIWPCLSREERSRRKYEQREDGVWMVDTEAGEEKRLTEPTPSGTNTVNVSSRHSTIEALPSTEAEVDEMIPLDEEFDRELFLSEGRNDAASAIQDSLGLLHYGHISSPFWMLYGLLGYEGMLLLPMQDFDLTVYACERILKNVRQKIRRIAALGADAVWIEECLTDQISPGLFRDINKPFVQQCVREILENGMKSIYYYCGNPNDRLDSIMDVGADAVHFEESKKNFTIDIADIINKVDGRCVVFGNIDAIGVLEAGSEEELRAEVKRQLDAGRRNGNRFIMSTGSPITPGTPVEKVRLYTDIVRELNEQ